MSESRETAARPSARLSGGPAGPRPRFSILRVPKAPELVTQTIRSQIVHGHLREGDALPPEGELMAQFGVSRPTLREALRVLESEGVISVQRGSRVGPRVRVPDPNVAIRYASLHLQLNGTTVDDMLAAKDVLELAAVRTLAGRPSTSQLAELRAILVAEEDALGDHERFSAVGHEFHAALARATGVKTLTLLSRMLDGIARKTSVAGEVATNPTRAKRVRAHELHTEVVDRIAAGDVDGALDVWKAHLDRMNRATTARVGGRQVLDLMG